MAHGQFFEKLRFKSATQSSASFLKNWQMIALQICNAIIAFFVFLEFWIFALQICNAIIGQFFKKLADDCIANLKCNYLKLEKYLKSDDCIADLQRNHLPVFRKTDR